MSAVAQCVPPVSGSLGLRFSYTDRGTWWSCGRALAARSSSLLGARQGSLAGRAAGGHEDVYTARGTRTFTRRVTHTCPPHRNALYTSAALYTVPTLYTMLEGSPLASA